MTEDRLYPGEGVRLCPGITKYGYPCESINNKRNKRCWNCGYRFKEE